MLHRFSRGLVQASAVIGYFEVSSQMKICGPHSSVILSAIAHTDLFTQRCPYTQTLSHTDTFTHRRFYTQTLLHTDTFTRDTFTQTRLHTNIFTHKHFYTQTLLHTETFTHRRYLHRRFYTQKFTHKQFYTQTLLHTDAFTHRSFYTQTLLHTDAFTHRRTQSQFYFSFWRSNLISCERDVRKGRAGQVETHKHFYTETLLHTSNLFRTHRRNFTSVFDDRTSFYAGHAFTHIAILLQFLAIQPHFVRKGRAKGSHRDNTKSQFYLSFCRSNLISCERVARDKLKSQFYLSFWQSNLISWKKSTGNTKSQFYLSF